MKTAYEIIREAMDARGVSAYRIAQVSGDDLSFLGRVLRGVNPMPDRLRTIIAEILDLDAEDLRLRILFEREQIDVAKVRAIIGPDFPPPPPDPPGVRSLSPPADAEEAV